MRDIEQLYIDLFPKTEDYRLINRFVSIGVLGGGNSYLLYLIIRDHREEILAWAKAMDDAANTNKHS